MSARSIRARPGRPLSLIALAWLVFPVSGLGQETKRALDHEDTRRWNSIQSRAFSADGRWLAYVISPWEGDPTLVITSADGADERRFRGRAPVFTRDSRFVAFRVPPVEAVLDSLELAGTPRDDLPGDSLAVVTLADAFGDEGTDTGVFRAGPIESFEIPEDGGAWIAYHLSEVPKVEGDDEADEVGPEAEEEVSDAFERWHEKDDAMPLVLRDLASGAEFSFASVTSYVVAVQGTALGYVTSTEDAEGDGAWVVDPSTGGATVAMAGEGHYRQLVFDEAGTRFAFVSDAGDWDAERPAYTLYRATEGRPAAIVADVSTDGMPGGWWVSEHGDVTFSQDGLRLFFGTAPRAEPEPEKILDEDRVEVDIWNWKDDYLQPMQLVQAEDERNRSYLAVAHVGSEEVVQLATLDVPDTRMTETGLGDYVLGVTDMPYRQEVSWDGRYQDAYAIDVGTGERRLIVAAVRGFGGASLSPDGTFAHWWDEADLDWKVARLDGGPPRSLTGSLSVAFFNELDDHPQGPPAYGRAVWTEGDEALLVYDKHDVWRTDPTGANAPVRLTDGRASNLRYRVIRLDDEGGNAFGFGFGGGAGGGEGVPNGPALFSTFELGTKASGFASGRIDRAVTPRPLVAGDVRYGRPTKARDAERLLWTRESFVEFPDLWVSGLDFADARKLTDVNAQQAEYRWGSAELVSWISADGASLDGILIKPDGFDPSRKYPMMVYFYERETDRIHAYQPPVPNRASIRYSFYASRGYVVFIPDIPYEIGYPGESALDAVVPGVLSLIEQGFIDPDRIGVQGHSWGGYQIAYMITKTNLFAAAEAGAPVSNMTSAYGGIRWQSGMSRMFQYERTQSRIGGTLWDERDRYIHNSPVFFVDKIRTPLLILHNDEDGAVPWYQGIEMFVAMRRLGRPAFMLNYNGEAHGLTRKPNQADWTIRMQQFFDHYLLDAAEPEWMADGVPAVDKGHNLGLKLVETTVSVEGAGGR